MKVLAADGTVIEISNKTKCEVQVLRNKRYRPSYKTDGNIMYTFSMYSETKGRKRLVIDSKLIASGK